MYLDGDIAKIFANQIHQMAVDNGFISYHRIIRLQIMVHGCDLDGCLKQLVMETFDAIIIGSGQAGNPLAKKLSREGRRVALIESASIGGTCINYGCTPTKTLVASLKIFSKHGVPRNMGILASDPVPDYLAISKRKNRIVADFRNSLERSLSQDPNITLFEGKGSFSGHKKIRVQLEGSKLPVDYCGIDFY